MRLVRAALAAALFLSSPAIAEELVIPEGGYVVSSDVSQLPEAVQRKRAALLEIAAGGDIAALGPIMDADQTVVSFGDPEDRIAYLREQSADGEGVQMLALLAELLEAPYAAYDGGDGSAVYIWPYFGGMLGLADLTAAQKVDAYKLVTPEQLDEMVMLEAWYWWRVSMGPEGNLQAFVAGD